MIDDHQVDEILTARVKQLINKVAYLTDNEACELYEKTRELQEEQQSLYDSAIDKLQQDGFKQLADLLLSE